MSDYYVIPAREGSKGLMHKNRKLFEYTAKMLIDNLDNVDNVIVTTDDEEIISEAKFYGFDIIKRSNELSNDTASMKDVLIDVRDRLCLDDDDNIILLYLTYPQRTFQMIRNALLYFTIIGADSMLCRIEPLTHPYLCVYADGSQVVKHNLCRRQDYPQVYEISHAIGIFKAGCLERLNSNLYNDETNYLPIERLIDVDTEFDLEMI